MYPVGWIVTPITVVLIGACGIIGNLLCIIVLSQKQMRSPYVYNIQGLAYSDLVLLIIASLRTLDKITPIPPWLLGNHIVFWPVWICNAGTKYFTVAVSVERFLVITYPLNARNWVTLTRAKISAILVFAFCVGLSVFSYVYLHYIDARSYSIWIVAILHFIPFVLIVIFNTFIFIGLRKYRRDRKTMSKAEMETESITRMLFMVVMLFCICSAVEVVRRIWIFFDNDLVAQPHYDHVINHVSDVLYVFNSAANFVIYYLWGKQFRKAFFKVFRCWQVGEDTKGSQTSGSDSGGASSTATEVGSV